MSERSHGHAAGNEGDIMIALRHCRRVPDMCPECCKTTLILEGQWGHNAHVRVQSKTKLHTLPASLHARAASHLLPTAQPLAPSRSQCARARSCVERDAVAHTRDLHVDLLQTFDSVRGSAPTVVLFSSVWRANISALMLERANPSTPWAKRTMPSRAS